MVVVTQDYPMQPFEAASSGGNTIKQLFTARRPVGNRPPQAAALCDLLHHCHVWHSNTTEGSACLACRIRHSPADAPNASERAFSQNHLNGALAAFSAAVVQKHF
jgi:hypothetical protein